MLQWARARFLKCFTYAGERSLVTTYRATLVPGIYSVPAVGSPPPTLDGAEAALELAPPRPPLSSFDRDVKLSHAGAARVQ